MDEKLKILLCEDDENLGMLLREYLAAKGYTAELCPDGDAGYKAFLKTKFDICVLDVMMPKKDGFTLAQEIRQANADIPIIFLTAKTLKEDILEGFKIGADDYITKPFSMEELVFRIEAILRRVRGKKNKESSVYRIGGFTFDTQKQLLVIGDKQTKLTTKENELLALLCSHANEILQRDFALKTIWIDDNYFNARSMDVYITKLRKHLKDDPQIEVKLRKSGKCFVLCPIFRNFDFVEGTLVRKYSNKIWYFTHLFVPLHALLGDIKYHCNEYIV